MYYFVLLNNEVYKYNEFVICIMYSYLKYNEVYMYSVLLLWHTSN